MKIPQGKTVFLWQIRGVAKGDPAAIAEQAKAMGATAVFIKLADGPIAYNLRQAAIVWVDDLVQPVIAALEREGIEAWGWQYIYGEKPAAEADRAAERMGKFQLAGWVIDAEEELKGKISQAALYMRRLRDGLPNACIGLTTYRYPTLHPELPWAELMTGIDFHMPQVSWADSHNPGQQLERCVREYRALEKRLKLRELPIVPIGAAYHEHGWQPTAEEMREFVAMVKAMGLPGYSMWEGAAAERCGLGATLMMLDTLREEPAPVLSVEDRLARLEKAARLAGWRLG